METTPYTVVMPQLGETVTEGTVAQWLKRPGDAIEKYEPFVEVSTDKVNAEVPAPVAGILRTLIVAEGATVPTGSPIAIIDYAGAPAAAPPVALPAASPTEPVAVAAPAARAAADGRPGDGPRLSPAVRRLARERAIDLAGIRGTGTKGRITAADVLAAGNGAPRPPAPAALPGAVVPLTAARRLIAQRMVESKHTAPHAWTMVEVDVTEVWRWREAQKTAFERDHGVKLTLLPFFLRAVVEALAEFPLMNASFTDAGIAVHRAIHLGIAVAAGGNLFVPVIRNAGELSIAGLARAAAGLIEKARGGKLAADDLAGGTFTVNNTGANGAILSAPILVPGQAGIVTMEAVVKRPVVRHDDAIAIRSMMNVCLSLDHRVVDGAIASGFLVAVKTRLQGMGPNGAL